LFTLPPITWLWFTLWVVAVLIFYLAWSRKHSALNDGGDGYIPGQVPGDDDVMFVEEPSDHHFVTKHEDEP
jgi:basic amino acid/polyamine antiporter, APA family